MSFLSIAVKDIESRKIPNIQLLLLFCLTFSVDVINGDLNVFHRLVTAIFYALIFIIIKFITKGIGLGDVKLAAVVGYEIGFMKSVTTFFIGCVGGMIFILLKNKNGSKGKCKIPFAPFISFGSLVSDFLFILIGIDFYAWF